MQLASGRGWGERAEGDCLLSAISAFHRRLRDARSQGRAAQGPDVAGKE